MNETSNSDTIIIQYDIFGNIVPQKLCKCGCGEPVYGNNDWIRGHHIRVINPMDNLETRGKVSKTISQWFKGHPEEMQKRGENYSQWCKDHPEEVKLKGRRYSQWCKDYPEEKLKQGKKHSQWCKDHPEEKTKQGENHSQWCKDHPEKMKIKGENYSQWCKDHPEEVREKAEKYSAMKQGIPYDEWESFACEQKYCPKFNETCKESNREKYGRRCYICDKTEIENGKKLSVHHVDMNKQQGCDGINWKLIPVCKNCHGSLHTKNNVKRIEYVLSLGMVYEIDLITNFYDKLGEEIFGGE